METDAGDPSRRRLPDHAGGLRHMYGQNGGSIIYMGSVHSKEASVLKAPYVTAKHGLIGLAKVVAKEGAPHGVRANVICPGFVRTPLVDKQIPEQAKALGISEQDVIKNVMLKETVDGEFTTLEDVAETALFFAASRQRADRSVASWSATAGSCNRYTPAEAPRDRIGRYALRAFGTHQGNGHGSGIPSPAKAAAVGLAAPAIKASSSLVELWTRTPITHAGTSMTLVTLILVITCSTRPGRRCCHEIEVQNAVGGGTI